MPRVWGAGLFKDYEYCGRNSVRFSVWFCYSAWADRYVKCNKYGNIRCQNASQRVCGAAKYRYDIRIPAEDAVSGEYPLCGKGACDGSACWGGGCVAVEILCAEVIPDSVSNALGGDHGRSCHVLYFDVGSGSGIHKSIERPKSDRDDQNVKTACCQMLMV